MFAKETIDRENRDKAHEKYEQKIDMWIGRGPMKNHVKVLLCTI